MEKIKRAGKSKYGFFLQKEDGSYTGCTEQVTKFLNGKLPAEVEIIGKEGEGKNTKVTRVKILNSTPQAQVSKGGNDIEKMSKLKNRIMARCSALDNATKLVIAEQETKTPEVVLTYAEQFLKFIEGEEQ
jgi:ABC-type phosphate/phosphonate transport system ATPase subunit